MPWSGNYSRLGHGRDEAAKVVKESMAGRAPLPDGRPLDVVPDIRDRQIVVQSEFPLPANQHKIT
jgi:hypothetical protein